MKQSILLFGLFILLTSGKKPAVTLGTIELFNKQVSIKVPAQFELMNENRMKKVFHSAVIPDLAYSNIEKDVRIGFDAEAIGSKESGIPMLTIRFEKILKKLHPKANWKSQGVEVINGQKVGYIEYINKAPSKFYELLFFTSFKGQLLSCTFHAPKKGHRPWKKIAHEIMQSMTIKK
ncbi:MAG: hypothetical protein ACI857_003006 [Arenicella sp.]|jgi:hypothetical protein